MLSSNSSSSRLTSNESEGLRNSEYGTARQVPEPSVHVDQGAEEGKPQVVVDENRKRFDELLVSLCVDFINRPAEQIAEALPDALQRIGDFTGADRCFLYRYDESDAEMVLQHAWIAEGAPAGDPELERLPTEQFAWEHERLLADRAIYVPDTENLPEEARGLRWLYSKLEVKSSVNLALITEDRLIGVLGFSNVRERRLWSEDDIAVAQVFSQLLVSVLERSRDMAQLRKAKAELEYRLGFENLLLSLTSRFLRLPPENFDAEYGSALRQVAEFTGVCRAYIYLYDPKKQTSYLKGEWHSVHTPDVPDTPQALPIKDYSWAVDKLRAGRSIHVPSLSVIPEEESGFRKKLEERRVMSFMIVPMKIGDEVLGHLGCTTYLHEKTWSEDEIALLWLLGDVIINAQKRREDQLALATSERRLRLTVESLEEGVFDWNIQSGHAYISDHLKRAVGLTSSIDGWSFNTWGDRIHPDDYEEVMANLTKHLEGQAELYDAEYRFRTENNGYRWMHSRGRVVEFDEAGKPMRMVGVQRDITPKIHQREEQRRMESQMMHLGRVATMGETVAGIAHEVNQPLHAATAFCAASREALRSDQAGSCEKAIALSDKASEQIHRAGEIIHRLREFTRPRPTEMGAVDLNELVRLTTEFYQQLGKLQGVQLVQCLAPSALMVCADRVQVQQVLINLIQNAIDSLHESGGSTRIVTLTTRADQGFAEVEVLDNALSPPVADTEALFEAFFTTKPDGMGIGLSLCRTIIAAHGGKIHATAGAESGMAFRFTLPLDKEATL